MKNIIRNVLERYTGREANLDSLTLREMIVDEIADELESKGIRIDDLYHKSDYIDDDLSI
jgi:hypothetical protein